MRLIARSRMVDAESLLDVVVGLFERVGVEVRREPLGGSGGGLCVLRGRRIVFIDTDADAATRLETSARALAALPEVNSLYISPALRDLMERAAD